MRSEQKTAIKMQMAERPANVLTADYSQTYLDPLRHVPPKFVYSEKFIVPQYLSRYNERPNETVTQQQMKKQIDEAAQKIDGISLFAENHELLDFQLQIRNAQTEAIRLLNNQNVGSPKFKMKFKLHDVLPKMSACLQTNVRPASPLKNRFKFKPKTGSLFGSINEQ